MSDQAGGRRRRVHAISSTRSGIGKTLYARTLVACLSEAGPPPLVFDTDAPEGDLATFAESHARVVDLARVEGQMALFDTLVAAGFSDAVIDLGRAPAATFLSLGSELALFGPNAPGNLRFVHHFLIDPSERAVEQALRLKHTLGVAGHVVAVENRFVFDPETEHYPDAWWTAEPFATVAIPAMPVIGHSLLVRRELGFLAFRRGEWSSGSLVLDHALKRFLDLMFEQIGRLQMQLDLSELDAFGCGG